MLDLLHRIRHPEVFQGRNQRRHYFEGWYYKVVDRDEHEIRAIIPGISLGAGPDDAHAFVQTIDGMTRETRYHRYRFAEFEAARDRLEVRIGPNRFTRDCIEIDLPDDLSGRLRFADLTAWPGRPLRPGIMGWFAFVPFMECYHGIVSLDHRTTGSLRRRGRLVDFTGGRGYTEKDWGRSFPRTWVWLQSNHFSRPGTSLTLSAARIPWLGSQFAGLIVGLLHDRQLDVFATYTGARLQSLQVRPDSVELTIRDRYRTLEVSAVRTAGGTLQSPVLGKMDGRIAESITARVRAILRDRRSGALLFDDLGRNCGLEVVGDTGLLVPRSGS